MVTVRIFAALMLLLATSPIYAQQQELYFPPIGSDQWETVSLNELGWDSQKVDELLSYVEANKSKAFIVLKNGRIAIEWYANDFEMDDFWYWASAGKTVTATLVGIAQAEGKLSINDKTSTYLGAGWTSLEPEQEDAITVRHQLTMTSGLSDRGDPYCTDKECLTYEAAAGTRWAYHNAPYTLLDGVIEAATGATLNSYYTTKLAQPIGMNGLFFKSGFNNVLTTTPRSMARFGLLALNNYVWNGTAVLTDAEYGQAMRTTSQNLNKSYGYLWWLNGKESFMLPATQFVFPGMLVPEQPSDGFNALGKNDQILSVVPSQGIVMVRMGDAAGADGPAVPTVFPRELWRLLTEAMGNPTSVEDTDRTSSLTVDVRDGTIIVEGASNVSLVSITGGVIARSSNGKLSANHASGLYFVVDHHRNAVKLIRL